MCAATAAKHQHTKSTLQSTVRKNIKFWRKSWKQNVDHQLFHHITSLCEIDSFFLLLLFWTFWNLTFVEAAQHNTTANTHTHTAKAQKLIAIDS